MKYHLEYFVFYYFRILVLNMCLFLIPYTRFLNYNFKHKNNLPIQVSNISFMFLKYLFCLALLFRACSIIVQFQYFFPKNIV